jgi:hypothetical protein
MIICSELETTEKELYGLFYNIKAHQDSQYMAALKLGMCQMTVICFTTPLPCLDDDDDEEEKKNKQTKQEKLVRRGVGQRCRSSYLVDKN